MFLTFSHNCKQNEQIDTISKFVSSSFVPVLSVKFLASVSLFASISQFLQILDNFENAYLTLNIHISAK